MTSRDWKILLVGMALATPATGRAQEATPEATGDVTQLDADTPSAELQPEPALDPAWEVYHRAFVSVAKGDRQGARRALEELVERFPDHIAAERARQLLPVVSRAAPKAPAWRPGDREEPTGLARAELASYQTLHGIGLAIELCGLAECDDPSAWAAALLAGGGIGLGASLGLTGGGVRPGQALLYDSATSLGFFNGLAIWGIAELQDKEIWAILIGSQLAGLGAGIGAYHLFEPSDGAVSLANSGALWSGLLSVFLHGINSFDASGDTIWTTSLIAVDGGMAAGALLASRFPMSRGRTLIIDSGGLLGMLTGMGLAVIFRSSVDDEKTFFAMSAAGTVSGLALATWLSVDWDGPEIAEDLDASLTVVPTVSGPRRDARGAQALFSVHF